MSETTDRMALALHEIIEEAEQDIEIDNRDFYEKASDVELEINGRLVQVVVKVIFDRKGFLDGDTIYWRDKDVAEEETGDGVEEEQPEDEEEDS